MRMKRKEAETDKCWCAGGPPVLGGTVNSPTPNLLSVLLPSSIILTVTVTTFQHNRDGSHLRI